MDNKLNLKNISIELELMMNLISGNHLVHSYESIDWEHFLDLSIQHRVFPLLYTKIKAIEDVPASVIRWLSQQYKQNTFKMLRLTSEMERVSRLLAEQQINTIFLKGPVLAQDLYGDLSLRTSSDLDFLIPIECLDQAEAILARLGYEKHDYIKTILNDWRWRHHHVTYVHPQSGMKLEIHWRLHPGPGKEPNFKELWERRRKSTILGSSIYLLGREDLFLFLVAHGARHGWSRLRWLVDIERMMLMDIDWKQVHQLFKIYYNPHVGGQAIILATELLNAVITVEMHPFLTRRSKLLANGAIFYLERMVNLHTNPVPKEIARYHERHLFSLMSLKQKGVYLLSLLYPLPEDAKMLPLPPKLQFLYFPLRPMLWAWRKTKKQVVS